MDSKLIYFHNNSVLLGAIGMSSVKYFSMQTGGLLSVDLPFGAIIETVLLIRKGFLLPLLNKNSVFVSA